MGVVYAYLGYFSAKIFKDDTPLYSVQVQDSVQSNTDLQDNHLKMLKSQDLKISEEKKLLKIA